MAKISANNFLSGAITSDKLETSVATNLASANSANATAVSALVAAQATYNSANTNSTSASNLPPVISSITITDSSWTPLDDTAANTNGGYCVISGTGFVSGATVTFGTTSASAVTFSNTTSLRVQVPTLSAASYPVYVVNPNGATAIKVNGLTTSSFPVWGTGTTLTGQTSNTSFSVLLSANSDSSITYSNTTALPAGTSLLANGYFYGTVSIGSTTTYSFDVDARDAEYQDALRTFSLTVTVIPQYTIWSFGLNTYGQLGQNDAISRSSPVQVGAGTTWSKISGGLQFTMAIKSDGTLWGWGRNVVGSIGVNDTIARSSPIQVGVLTNWSKVSCAGAAYIAIKTDGTLWVCGEDPNGMLGLNTRNVNRSSPTQVGALTNWSKGKMNGLCGFAIKTDGTLWSWGFNAYGTLGQNDTVYKSSPVQVGSGTTWSDLGSGGQQYDGYTAIATKTDGTLWMWGQNINGQLGLNDVNYRSSPTQISGSTWSTALQTNYNGFAVKSDGTLWGWGRNNRGQLGKNDLIYRSSPVQIGADTNWSNVIAGASAGGAFVIAQKTNNTLWSWGYNFDGPLGQNDTVFRSSPVQIGSETNWNLANTCPGQAFTHLIKVQ